jgi:hypothetical protein
MQTQTESTRVRAVPCARPNVSHSPEAAPLGTSAMVDRGPGRGEPRVPDLDSCLGVTADNVHYVKSYLNSGGCTESAVCRTPPLVSAVHGGTQCLSTSPAGVARPVQPGGISGLADRRIHPKPDRTRKSQMVLSGPTDPWPSAPAKDVRRLWGAPCVSRRSPGINATSKDGTGIGCPSRVGGLSGWGRLGTRFGRFPLGNLTKGVASES